MLTLGLDSFHCILSVRHCPPGPAILLTVNSLHCKTAILSWRLDWAGYRSVESGQAEGNYLMSLRKTLLAVLLYAIHKSLPTLLLSSESAEDSVSVNKRTKENNVDVCLVLYWGTL